MVGTPQGARAGHPGLPLLGTARPPWTGPPSGSRHFPGGRGRRREGHAPVCSDWDARQNWRLCVNSRVHTEDRLGCGLVLFGGNHLKTSTTGRFSLPEPPGVPPSPRHPRPRLLPAGAGLRLHLALNFARGTFCQRPSCPSAPGPRLPPRQAHGHSPHDKPPQRPAPVSSSPRPVRTRAGLPLTPVSPSRLLSPTRLRRVLPGTQHGCPAGAQPSVTAVWTSEMSPSHMQKPQTEPSPGGCEQGSRWGTAGIGGVGADRCARPALQGGFALTAQVQGIVCEQPGLQQGLPVCPRGPGG